MQLARGNGGSQARLHCGAVWNRSQCSNIWNFRAFPVHNVWKQKWDVSSSYDFIYLLNATVCLFSLPGRGGGGISRILLFETLKSVAISDAVSIYVRRMDQLFTVTWFKIYGYLNLLTEPSSYFILFTGNTFFFRKSTFRCNKASELDRRIQCNDWLMTGQGEEGWTNVPKIYIPILWT